MQMYFYTAFLELYPSVLIETELWNDFKQDQSTFRDLLCMNVTHMKNCPMEEEDGWECRCEDLTCSSWEQEQVK